MRISVPHNTTRAAARARVEQRFSDLLGQYGHHADDRQHEWDGDTLHFKGKARGLSVEGSVEVTDQEVIIDAKLPLIAFPFESGLRSTVKREAEEMFRGA